MDSMIYSPFSAKVKKNKLPTSDIDASITLESVLKQDFEIITKEQVVKGFCNDLRILLKSDDVYELIHGIFAIEHNISYISENIFEDGNDLPTLGEFHRNLSPVLLRALLDNAASSDSDSYNVEKEWKEALRISIEEELYIWQERSF
jgi:hypothetical protein